LCGLFATHERLPSGMGEVLKLWTEEVYWKTKQDGHRSAAAMRPDWDELVQRLAWQMNVEKKTFLPFNKAKQVVESFLAELLKPHAPANVESYLNQVVDLHLIQ